MSPRQYDVLIYGATGFTGEFIAYEVARRAAKEGWRYALAGRSETKLKLLHTRVAQVAKDDTGSIEVADVNDGDGLRDIFGKTRLVINAVGPYRFYGQQVVTACIDAGADYVDITGEPQFMDQMALKYYSVAKAAGVAVVHACGFDSVPADCGCLFFEKKLQAKYPNSVLHSVESFLDTRVNPKLGTAIHFATYECVVHGFGDVASLKGIRKQLVKGTERQQSIKRVNVNGLRPPKISKRPYKEKRVGGKWALVFPGADAAVVRNTQTLRANLDNNTPQLPFYSAYFLLGSTWVVICFAIFGIIAGFLAKYSWGRKMLLTHCGLFTRGIVSHAGPTEGQRKGTKAYFTFFAKGFKNREDLKSNPDVQMEGHISCGDPGYEATAAFIVECGKTLLVERDTVPGKGGVFTPGVAFCNSSICDRLEADPRFEFVVDKICDA